MATGALVANMIAEVLVALAGFVFLPEDDAMLILELLSLVSLLICVVVVGMWIYRTNANAHSFGVEMSITPGWAVGWFFVPLANLVMPFQAMKEVWDESHRLAGRHEEMESSLIGWWWGLWIASNIAANLPFYPGGDTPAAVDLSHSLQLISAGVSVAASVALILLMRRLDDAQIAASRGSVFA
ncbi:MAG TPA: DUF4328 domain-containing protein [Allosphingosinicella sp.]